MMRIGKLALVVLAAACAAPCPPTPEQRCAEKCIGLHAYRDGYCRATCADWPGAFLSPTAPGWYPRPRDIGKWDALNAGPPALLGDRCEGRICMPAFRCCQDQGHYPAEQRDDAIGVWRCMSMPFNATPQEADDYWNRQLHCAPLSTRVQ